MNHQYLAALAYATKAHGSQLRKGTEIPYITHPMGVASIVLDYGGSDTQAIAALLHDVVEDCGGVPRLDDVREVFGRRVADIVALCSDSLRDSGDEKQEWRARKEHHLAHLRDYLTPAEAVVIAADKLHNLRAIARDVRVHGVALWALFKGGYAGTAWYYAQMTSALSYAAMNCGPSERENADAAIVFAIVDELERLFAEVWP